MERWWRMKRKKTEAVLEPQKFSVGETVKINRPHLWSDCVGEVVSFKDGMHRIKIKSIYDGFDRDACFHTDAPASQLESFI